MATPIAAGTVMVNDDGRVARIIPYHKNKASMSRFQRYLLRHSSSKVSVIPLTEKQLREAGWTPRHEKKK